MTSLLVMSSKIIIELLVGAINDLIEKLELLKCSRVFSTYLLRWIPEDVWLIGHNRLVWIPVFELHLIILQHGGAVHNLVARPQSKLTVSFCDSAFEAEIKSFLMRLRDYEKVDEPLINSVVALRHFSQFFVFHTYRSQLVVTTSLFGGARSRFVYDHLAYSIDKLALRSSKLAKNGHCRQPLAYYELL